MITLDASNRNGATVEAWDAGGLDFIITEGEANAHGYRYFLNVYRDGRELDRTGHDTLGQCHTMARHLSTPLPLFAEDDLALAAAEFDLLKRPAFSVEPVCGVSGAWYDPSDDDATTFDFGFDSDPTVLSDANGQFGYRREIA